MAKQRTQIDQRTFESLDSVPALPDGFYFGDKPNPSLEQFVAQHATPYGPETDNYDVRAFTQPIETKRSTAIFNMHTYWSKKPHDAIRQYIRHYTRPGDLVLDPFCGSGGTALAALLENRVAIALDRSPAATFLTRNHCFPPQLHLLQRDATSLLSAVKKELNWLYETRCDRCGGKATTIYTIVSQVFQCPRCLRKTPLYDCVETDGQTSQGKSKRISICPHCHQGGYTEEISTRGATFGHTPVEVVYHCLAGCKPAKGRRNHNDADSKKRQFFAQHDIGRLKEIERKPIPFWVPPHRMMNVADDSKPWGDKWRAGTSNFRTVADLFTKRNLWAVAAVLAAIREGSFPCSDALLFTLTSILLKCSKMMAHNNDGIGRIQKGTYYIPQLIRTCPL